MSTLRAERELDELEQLIRALPQAQGSLADLFAGAREVTLARAPGRLDVMGGFADYSGSLVLQLPLAEAACVATAPTRDAWIRVASLGPELREARFSAPELWRACESLLSLRQYFARLPAAQRWAAYVLGGLPLLAARGARLGGGLRVLLRSSVPEGKGVSSSAAIEVAALAALAALHGIALAGPELGLACQQVENQVVGAACGVMDQMTSACGRAQRLLALQCQPAELRGFLSLPEGVGLFGIDSGLRHSVQGSRYTQVRVVAFMGARILAERLGARVHPLGPGRVELEGDPLGGYLCRLTPGGLAPELLLALPERLSGAAFVERFGGIADPVTSIEPGATYMVRAATLHPIFEHQRVTEFYDLLQRPTEAPELRRLGELMRASHASYSACGLGSDGTDELAQGLTAAGPETGVFGAKITGGGSGGTVAVLARTDQRRSLELLSQAYAVRSGRSSRLFCDSSPGAAEVPARRFSQ